MNDVAKWRQLTGDHLGKQKTKQTTELMADLLSVDCGLKSALLLDFAPPSVSSVIAYLRALKTSGLLENDLLVVTVGLDLLIIKTECFSDAPDNWCEQPENGFQWPKHCYEGPEHYCERPEHYCEQLFSNIIFIDVSANLDSPEIIGASSRHHLEKTKTCFEIFLNSSKLKDCGASLDLPVCCSDGDNPSNPSTLFGLFLGYPVVYFYDLTLDRSGNCLAMVPLVNIVVKGRQLYEKDGFAEAKDHVVTSFSVPELFWREVESRVETWFRRLREGRAWRCLFSDLTMERRVLQLPSVCL